MPKTTDGVCVFGWKPSEMAVAETRPADFRQFWDKAMDAYAKIPLDAKIEDEAKVFKGKEIDEYNLKSACLPGNYDPEGCKVDEVESFKISFAGPDGGRVYAWLAKPKGDGPFPAMLVLPGAGFAARPRPLEHARHGYLAIDVQIHGQDVDLPKYEKLPGYNDNWVYEPADKFYFMNVYLRAARAVDYLCSRPDVDARRVVTAGGSQGGRLSIVVPALDKRVAATVPCIANSPNYPNLRWVAVCNGSGQANGSPFDPKAPKSDGMDVRGAPPVYDNPEAKCWAYYDPMNFAPDVRCPALFNGGLIDPVSPPYSVWAAFNKLGSEDKRIVPLPGFGHDWYAEFDRQAWRWLDSKLKAQQR
jgi:cephalosporin-C deacetylase-like acetyl esterase